MARDISTIQAQIETEIAAQPVLAALTSVSSTALFRAIIYIVAVAVNLHEQVLDVFKIELEEVARKAIPGTASWIKDKAFEFQYDAATPQVIQMINGYPTYATIDTTKNIITRCSVKQQPNRTVKIKVAKGTTGAIVPLTSGELNAYKSYMDKMKMAGVPLSIVSLNPDRVKLVMEVFFLGEYVEATVKAAVIAAVENYYANLDFDGVVMLSKITDAIQAVPGVKDVMITTAIGHDASTAPTSPGASLFTRVYETTAGHLISEDTAGHTLNDTITMTLAS